MTDVALRDIRSSDFEALYRLDQACFEPGIAYSREELRRFLSLSTAQAVAAENQGVVVGFAVGYVAAGQIGHVVTLDVATEHRHRGVGRALLEELVRRLSAPLVKEIRLEVDTQNKAAILFYERFGFRKQRRLADYYGPKRPGWEMSLGLKV